MSAAFGKSLQRSKKKDHNERRMKYITALETRNMANKDVVDETFHGGTKDLSSQQHSTTLKSVWDTSNIENFLMAADAKAQGYIADRNVRVVVDGAAHIVIGDKVAPLSDNQRDWLQLSAKLPIPRRPVWNFAQSTQDINVQELSSFHRWREALNGIEEKNKVLLSPYEKNLEVWRQLWRVVERSDVVVNVVDARNPLAFRCRDFELYVSDHAGATGRPKPVVLLLNKADLLNDRQRDAWADYLNRHGITFYFFAARSLAETDAARNKSKAGRNVDSDDDENLDDEEEEEDDEAEAEAQRKQEELLKEQLQNPNTNKKSARRGEKRRSLRGGVQTEATSYRLSRQPVRIDEEGSAQFDSEQQQQQQGKKNNNNKKGKRNNNQDASSGVEGDVHLPPQGAVRPTLPSLGDMPLGTSKLFNASELVDVFATFWKSRVHPADANTTTAQQPQQPQQPVPVMVGFVGYPNVGKSSTINALIGCKKVVVSATPGKTKHFQTLPIPNEDRVMLCDCPGLVFPSCAATKETMVCDGVLPIDNCRDFVSPISIVCRRVPRIVLQRHYHLEADQLDPSNDIDHSTSLAEVMLASVARKRGQMTDHDRPNRSKAAREVLKDFVDGRFPYVHPPPDFLRLPQWGPWKEVQEIVQLLSMPEPDVAKMESLAQHQHNQHHHNHNHKEGDAKKETEKKVNVDNVDDDEEDDEANDDDAENAVWEDVDDDDEELEDFDEARDLSDDGEDSDDDELDPRMLAYLETQERLNAGARFYDHKKARENARLPQQQKNVVLTLEEQFNLDNETVANSYVDPEVAGKRKSKKKKMKSHHALKSMSDPDPTYRVTSQGYKQVVFDDDDEIDVVVKMTPEQHEAMMRARRRVGGGTNKKIQGAGPQQPFIGDEDDDIVVSGGAEGVEGGFYDDGTGMKEKRLTKKQLRRVEKKQQKSQKGMVDKQEGADGFMKRGIVR